MVLTDSITTDCIGFEDILLEFDLIELPLKLLPARWIHIFLFIGLNSFNPTKNQKHLSE